VGWFGFNAGSNLEANGTTALAFANTLFATAAATLSWIAGEALAKGKGSMLGADDSLDVFGVHGVGGILGALLTGVFASPSLGGTGIYDYVANKVSPDYSIGGQVWIQLKAVLLTVVWSGVVALVAFKIVDMLVGLRVSEEDEREGLDISAHGETAYHN
ncbi:MAG: ammonia channel protein, partial [Rubrivivax sp.]